jgi:hypothetical protein
MGGKVSDERLQHLFIGVVLFTKGGASVNRPNQVLTDNISIVNKESYDPGAENGLATSCRTTECKPSRHTLKSLIFSFGIVGHLTEYLLISI